MSFLLDGEEQAMLADALAFIDTFAHEEEEEEGTSSDNSSTGSETSSLYVELRIPRATDSAKDNGVASDKPSSSGCSTDSSASGCYDSARGDDVEYKKRVLKTREANTRAVYRYRKRNKAEILDLREQVGKLTSQLAELRNPDTVAITGHGSGYPRFNPKTKLLQLQPTTAAASFDNALMEYRKRQQSEALNHKLKDALTKQRRMNALLESVFQKHVSKIDLNFVMEIESQLQKKPKTCHEELLDHENAMAYSELQLYLRETVYKSTPAVVSALAKNDINCVFYHTLTKNDERVGKMIEFMSNTPLQCSIEQLEPLLWSQMVRPRDNHNVAQSDNHNVAQSMAEEGHGNIGSCGRSFKMDLDGQQGKVHVSGMSGIHKFVEPHRIVITYTSLFSVEGSDLLLRENGWLIISDALVSGCESAPTVFQTVYRLHAGQKNTMPMTPETQTLRDFVMTAQSDKMREYQLMLQNLLLEQRDWVSRAVGGLARVIPTPCCAFEGLQIQQAMASAALGV